MQKAMFVYKQAHTQGAGGLEKKGRHSKKICMWCMHSWICCIGKFFCGSSQLSKNSNNKQCLDSSPLKYRPALCQPAKHLYGPFIFRGQSMNALVTVRSNRLNANRYKGLCRHPVSWILPMFPLHGRHSEIWQDFPLHLCLWRADGNHTSNLPFKVQVLHHRATP